MKKTAILIGALACCLSSAALAHDHIRKIRIPDIEGYKTLVCEFHTHTIYSDGSVMPSVRVGEALNEGIHVIAVTEHIEDYCRKIPETNPVDLNTSYNLYKEAAEGTGLIVIRGGEISRGMPPGHLNALFLKDVNPLNTEYTDQGAWDAVEEAASQGAFIIWNHPGWKPQQPDSTCWFDFHTRMHERGWLHGIEICNYLDGCYPETLTWYGEKNLAPIAGSDTHGPTFYEFDLVNSHRPVTLVFAREQTEEGVREALFDRRSVAYDNNFLYGAERWLQAIFRASVRCKESGRTAVIAMYSRIPPISNSSLSSSRGGRCPNPSRSNRMLVRRSFRRARSERPVTNASTCSMHGMFIPRSGCWSISRLGS